MDIRVNKLFFRLKVAPLYALELCLPRAIDPASARSFFDCSGRKCLVYFECEPEKREEKETSEEQQKESKKEEGMVGAGVGDE